VAVLRHIVESRILAVEDIQPAVVRRRKVVDTVTLVVGTVEMDMVLALEQDQQRDWAPERKLQSGLMAAMERRKVEILFHSSVRPCS